ncbi:hypothetical protein PBN151_0676 [Paenibacillus sp. NAIST15-1]|nr:hypothetical protein PBN151_0676 [Paenibacillus sp. NAIST15-1]
MVNMAIGFSKTESRLWEALIVRMKGGTFIKNTKRLKIIKIKGEGLLFNEILD